MLERRQVGGCVCVIFFRFEGEGGAVDEGGGGEIGRYVRRGGCEEGGEGERGVEVWFLGVDKVVVWRRVGGLMRRGGWVG